jgi:Ner family transcriptional regulator
VRFFFSGTGNMDKQDWHPADIAAALKKRGHTLASISIANGYHSTAVGKALRQPWPAVEVIVAKALGVAPEVIWPSRWPPTVQAADTSPAAVPNP